MTLYANVSGKSSVVAYDIYLWYMRVVFRKTKYTPTNIYMYYYKDIGIETLNTMKALAKSGKGLNTFINKHKPKYYHKE